MLLERLLENLAMEVEPFTMVGVARGERLRHEELDWVTAHFVLSGSGTIRVGRGVARPLRRFSLALVPERHVYTLDAAAESELEHAVAGIEGLPGEDLGADPGLAEVLEAVLADPGFGWNLELLAERAAMSRTAFGERFARQFGTTPMAWVRGVRLRDAARLLRRTDLTVETLGKRVGYSSRSHFTAAFRGYFGITPARFHSSGGTDGSPPARTGEDEFRQMS